MANGAQFRTEHVAAAPRGWRVRTRLQGAHRLRIAFPPGPRPAKGKGGRGQVVEILHPKGENPGCAVSKNPLGLEELVIFGNPSHPPGSPRRGPGAPLLPKGHKAGCACPVCRRRQNAQGDRIDWPQEMLDRLLESYHTWRRGGATKEKAIEQTLQGSLAGPAARKQFLEETAKKNPRQPNQADETRQAVRLFQTFHGKDPKGILEAQRSAAMRSDYTALGDLEYVLVEAPDGRTEKIDFEGDGVKLASAANGAQLYLIGGNQDLDGCLAKFTADTTKDLYDLGEAIEVQYLARKAVGNFEPVSWFHKFGEEGSANHKGGRPRLGYDRLRKELFFAGGEYRIEAPGIIN